MCWVSSPAVWQSANCVPAPVGAGSKQVVASSRCAACGAANKRSVREPTGRTSIALKNLPTDLTRESLMRMLNSQGLEGLYNLVYLPFDFATGRALGYATLNMETSYVAELAAKLLKGFSGWHGEKALDVCWNAPHQGLDELLAFYRNSRSMHASVPDEYRPVLLERGVQVAFPAPTRTIPEPFVSSH